MRISQQTDPISEIRGNKKAFGNYNKDLVKENKHSPLIMDQYSNLNPMQAGTPEKKLAESSYERNFNILDIKN